MSEYSFEQQAALRSLDPVDRLIHVDLILQPGKVEHRLCFGEAIAETYINRHRRLVSLAPDKIFCLMRWAANDYGTVVSRIDIIRCIRRGEAYQTLPFVRPGGEILLRLNGLLKVERVLAVIAAIEQLGIRPDRVAPAYWRHVHNRLAANMPPRRYTLKQHKAWILRLEILS